MTEECQAKWVATEEQIQSIISEMIPPGIGDLFFFDGEKIAEHVRFNLRSESVV